MAAELSSETTSQSTGAHDGSVAALVVDDNQTNRVVLSLILKQAGCDVSFAEDGAEGVAAATNTPFNIVFMDLHMPTMDGFEATRLIRETSGPNQGTPIVAVTADTTVRAEKKAREVGVDDYLAKPVEWDVIVDVLDRFAPRSATGR